MLASAPPASAHTAEFCRIVTNALERSENIVVVLERRRPKLWSGSPGLFIVDFSDSFLRASERDRGTALGARFPDMLGVASNAPVAQEIQRASAEGKPLRSELEIRTPKGEARWIGFHLMPTEHDGFVVLGRDITAQRLERKEQQAAQALLAKVYMVVDVPIAIMAADGQIVMTNPAFDELAGRTGQAGRGGPFLDVIGDEQRLAVGMALSRQFSGGGPCAMNVTLRAPPPRPDAPPAPEIEARLTSVVLDHPDLHRPRVVTLVPSVPLKPPPMPRVLVAGKVRLIGLELVRQALGPRWPEMKQRALQTAEHVVRRRIGTKDSYSRTDDDGVLICFADRSEDEASFRAAVIGREIRQRLIGVEDVPSDTQVRAIATSVPEPTIEEAPMARLVEAQLDGRRAAIEENARAVLAETIRGLAAEFADVLQRQGGALARYGQLPRDSEQKIIASIMSLPPEDALQCDLDLLRLRVISEDAIHVSNPSKRLPFLMDVSFDLFSSRFATDAYLAALRGLPQIMRQNLTLMFAHVPATVLRSRLVDSVRLVRPLVRDVGFRVGELELPPVELGAADAITVAISHGDLCADGIDEEGIFRFVQALHGRRGRLLVRDIPNQQAAVMLRELGVDLLAMAPKRAG